MLRNEPYIGRLVWNRVRFVKDPSTGKRVSRLNPEGDWIHEVIPDLRVINYALWDRVQNRLAGIRKSESITKIRNSKF
jgi:hypothetical protein